jgi:hypothetical protein
MCIQAVLPYGNLFGIIILTRISKYYDSGSFTQTKEINTKSITIPEFVARYSGPEV